MVKDSKKYASTGSRGFAHFNDAEPADEALLKTCFPCHQAVKERDLVFTVRMLIPSTTAERDDDDPQTKKIQNY